MGSRVPAPSPHGHRTRPQGPGAPTGGRGARGRAEPVLGELRGLGLCLSISPCHPGR